MVVRGALVVERFAVFVRKKRLARPIHVIRSHASYCNVRAATCFSDLFEEQCTATSKDQNVGGLRLRGARLRRDRAR